MGIKPPDNGRRRGIGTSGGGLRSNAHLVGDHISIDEESSHRLRGEISSESATVWLSGVFGSSILRFFLAENSFWTDILTISLDIGEIS